MKKEIWKRDKLGVVCLRAKKIDYKKQSGFFKYIDIGSIDSELKKVSEIQEMDWQEASSRARQVVQKGDTLFSTVRVNLERIAFLDSELQNTIASTGFTVIRSNGKTIPEYLFYSVSSPNFIERLVLLQKGTAYPAVTDRIVFDQEIPLPPIEEQKRIAAFFQSIDAAIEQCEQQEGKLRGLRSKLANDLVKPEPEFGSLLTSENCKPVTLADLANEMRENTKDPLEDGIERFVGLEHIEPGNLAVQGWGNVADGTTFTKTFAVGDVLFGKRRAYLKKAAIANFNGLCSGDILVLRPNAEVILPELFPYLISADAVFDFAVSNSAGSLSPRTKWRDLSKYELSIPDLKTQKKVLGVFESLQTNIRNINQQHHTLKSLKQKLLDDILS